MSYFWLSVIKNLFGRRSASEQRIVRPSIYARRVKYRSTLNDQVTTVCQEKLHVDKGHQPADCRTIRIYFVVLHRNTIDWQKKNRSAFVIFTDITCTIIGKALSSYHWALKCSRRPIHVVFGLKFHCFYLHIVVKGRQGKCVMRWKPKSCQMNCWLFPGINRKTHNSPPTRRFWSVLERW